MPLIDIFKEDNPQLLLAAIFDKIDMQNPTQFLNTLRTIETELGIYRERFRQHFVYCNGCKDFVHRSDAYEGIVYTAVHGLDDPNNSRPVLKCGKCNTILKYLD